MAALARRSVFIWHLSFYRGMELVRRWNACAQNGIDEKDSNENLVSAALSVEINSGIDDALSWHRLAPRASNCSVMMRPKPLLTPVMSQFLWGICLLSLRLRGGDQKRSPTSSSL